MPTESYDRVAHSGGFRIHHLDTGYVGTNDSTSAYLSRDKRSRAWGTQQRPYRRTLAYDDLRTTLLGYIPLSITKMRRSTTSKPYRPYRLYDGYPWISATGVTNVETHPTVDTTAAKLKCLESAGEVKWNLPLFVAEANQTIDMIASTAKTLAKGYKLFRKGNFKALKKHFGVSASGAKNSWMSWRYGWIPLFGDISSAAQAAASTLYYKGETKCVLVRGPRLEETVISDLPASDASYGFGSGLPSSPKTVTRINRQSTKAWLTLECRSRSLQLLEQFGIANPLALAWELVPMSFVADWFVGIGDYLSSQTALLGLRVLDGGTSSLSERILRSERKYAIPTSLEYETGLNPSYTLCSRNYVRRYWSGLTPPLRVDINLNFKRLVDSVALMDNVFRRK